MFKKTSVMRLMGLALCAFSINGCATPSQAYWDHKVKELCEKDGGITVFEHVELTQEEYKRNEGKDGFIVPPSETSSIAYKFDYLWKSTEIMIHERNPIVWRREYIIYRKSDQKVLGKMVSYTRSGGDIPTGISEDSRFSCADLKTISLSVEKQIFTVNGVIK